MAEYRRKNFRYQLSSNNCHTVTAGCHIELDEFSGHVIVHSLDRERADLIWLNVSVYDVAKLFRAAPHRILWLRVLDVNDNAPAFRLTTYTIEIRSAGDILEENEESALIFSENAVDRDAGENGTLTYELVRNHYDLFYVEKKSGKVWMPLNLLRDDQEACRDVFHLRLLCKDNGLPVFRFTTVDIYVKVIFVPHFWSNYFF